MKTLTKGEHHANEYRTSHTNLRVKDPQKSCSATLQLYGLHMGHIFYRRDGSNCVRVRYIQFTGKPLTITAIYREGEIMIQETKIYSEDTGGNLWHVGFHINPMNYYYW